MGTVSRDSEGRSGGGVCLWLTGRSGAGKSTLVAALTPLLDQHGREYSILDVVPLLAKHPLERTSEGKLLRKAFVAGEITRHGGIAICVTVSARASTREAARAVVGPDRFVEVYLDAPAEVCLERKGRREKATPLHKRLRRSARRWKSRLLRAESTDYQPPTNPDFTVDSVRTPPDEAARALVDLLIRRGFIDGSGTADEPR
jgi:sulfate adenylyltransferase